MNRIPAIDAIPINDNVNIFDLSLVLGFLELFISFLEISLSLLEVSLSLLGLLFVELFSFSSTIIILSATVIFPSLSPLNVKFDNAGRFIVDKSISSDIL